MSTVTGKVNTSYSSHITYIRCNFTVNKFPYFSLHSQVKTMKLCVLCALIISVPTTLLQIAKTMKILCHVQAFSQCIRLEMHISTLGCTYSSLLTFARTFLTVYNLRHSSMCKLNLYTANISRRGNTDKYTKKSRI